MATLTYAYAESTAVVGPLAPATEPHSWDLCARHADSLTAPLGWEMLRVRDIEIDQDEEITALAEAVREAGKVTSGLVNPHDPNDADDTALDPEKSNHPVYRSRRVAESRAAQRAHLHVVPDPEVEEED